MTWDPPVSADAVMVEEFHVGDDHTGSGDREVALPTRPVAYDLLSEDAFGLADVISTPRDAASDEPLVTGERRSAYEIAFLMLAAALAILVATPPLVQLFLAMRGIQA